MKIAVIEKGMSQYITTIFNQHTNLNIQISYMIEWDLKPEINNEMLAKLKDDISVQYDVILIAIRGK